MSKRFGLILNIVLGVLLILAIAGAVLFLMQNRGLKENNQILDQALLDVGTSLAFTNISPDQLKSKTGMPEAVAQINGWAQQVQTELQGMREALPRLTEEAAAAKGRADEMDTLVTDLNAQTNVLSQNLAKRDADIAAMKAAHDQALAKQQALATELQASLTKVQKEAAELQAQLKSVQAPGPEAGKGVEGKAEVAQAQAEQAKEKAREEAAKAKPPPPSIDKILAGGVKFDPGASQLFIGANYAADKKTMILLLRNEQVLTYQDVPEEVYKSLISAQVSDVFYRFKIRGNFKCTPDEEKALDAVNTHLDTREHPFMGRVRSLLP